MDLLPYILSLATYANKLCSRPQDAEDAIQDLFLKLWPHRETIEAMEHPKAYVKTALRCVVMDIYRRRDSKHYYPGIIPDQAQQPRIHGIIELKDVKKKLTNGGWLMLLEKASGYSSAELVQMYNVKNVNTINARTRYARMYLQKVS